MNIFHFLVCGKSEPESKQVSADNLNKAILKAEKDNPSKDVYFQQEMGYSYKEL